MNRQNALPFLRSAFQRLNVPRFPDRGSEILSDDPIFLTPPDAGHQQDAGLDAGAAQRQAFRGIGHSQPLGALGFEGARALHRAVAVTIGFDHRTNGDAFADVLLDWRENFLPARTRETSAQVRRSRISERWSGIFDKSGCGAFT